MAYDEVFRALSGKKARYLVAGGVAVNLLGVPRMTVDLDLLVDLAPANARRVVEALREVGFVPRVPVEFAGFANTQLREFWVREKNMLVFSVLRPERPWEVVDLFVDPPIPFADAWKRRRRIRLGDLVVPVVSARDLIAMKRKAGREQDLSDIEALRKLERLSDDDS